MALAACALMAASLSSAHPAKPTEHKLNRASVDPLVNILIISKTLLEKVRNED